MIHWGTVPSGAVLPFFFPSYDGATGASEAISGLAVTDIEVYKGTSMTQRSSDAGYTLLDTDGIDLDTMVGINGFSIDTGDNTDAGFYAVGSFFTVVVASITADAQTVNFVAGTFRLGPAESVTGYPKADVSHWLGTAAATPTVAGVPEVDITHWLGTAAATPTVAGVPEVDITHFGGSAGTFASGRPEVNTSHVAGTVQTAGDIIADTNDIQTRLPAALVSGRMASDVIAISGDTTSADNLETAFDDTAGPVPWLGILDQGTAQSATATTLVLRAAAAFADDVLNGATVWVLGSTQGYWQAGIITDYVSATDTATVTFPVTPSGTITYKVIGTAPTPAGAPVPANVVQLSGDATAADNAESFFDGTGYAGTGNTIPTVTTVGTVNALAANAVTASAVAADAVTEIQSGLATSAALTTLSALVDDLEGRLTAARAGYLDNLSAGAVALASGVTVTTNNDKTGYALSATGSAALTEGYSTDGAAGTLPQLLYEIKALLSEFAISGTTLTTKKLDGSTTAATYTLDSATSPTSITRAS